MGHVIRVVANWGMLGAAFLGIGILQHRSVEKARAALPALPARLSAIAEREWEHFPMFKDRVPVLAYHGIGGPASYLTVSRRLFAEQMLALHLAGFHTVSIGQYARFVRTGTTNGLPSKPILITFDDGRVDSYQGADAVLRKYGYRATMFAVAAWPTQHPGFALSWAELNAMQASGRWNVQEHAGSGHRLVPVGPGGLRGEFYAYRRWLPREHRLESYPDYEWRVTHDVLWGEAELREHITGYRPVAFAVPYSNYGQRATNDNRIPRFFLRLIHDHFAVMVDGDYLDRGRGRPFELKGRFSPLLTYRITQGPAMKPSDLHCRLIDFVRGAPIQSEYRCLNLLPGQQIPGEG